MAIRQDMPVIPDISATMEAWKREFKETMGVEPDEFMAQTIDIVEKKRQAGKLEPVKVKPPIEGIPTMAEVEEILSTVDPGTYENGNSKQFAVDEEGHGRVRVRVLAYGSELATLEAAEEALRGTYATMITRGTGSYSKDEELLVRPLPSVKGYHYREPDDKNKPLRVSQVMIREDVWQAILATSWEGRWGDDDITFETTRARVEKEWEDGFVGRDVIPFTVGLGTMFRMAKKKGEWDDAAREQFIIDAAEFYHVSAILAGARHQWRPSYSNGPQFGEWRIHADLLTEWGVIADEIATKEEEEREED